MNIEQKALALKIIAAVEKVTGVRIDRMRSTDHRMLTTNAREIVCHMCREEGLRVKDISELIGRKRDAASRYIKQYSEDCKYDRVLRELVNSVNARLEAEEGLL